MPSHVAPETPGSIQEGGELGYALVHAFGAAFDNPDLTVACVVGDGEAETGPLAAAWHSNKFLNPKVDGAVLPILHLNGYKIANPTLLARMSDPELRDLFTGYGYEPLFMATPSTDAPISPLRQRMQHDMLMRGLGSHTRQDYVRHVRCFAAFVGRSPDTATPDDIRRFQLDQHEKGVGPATINGAVSALRFLFLVTLQRRDLSRALVITRYHRKLPDVLSVRKRGDC